MAQVVATIGTGLIVLVLAFCVVYILGFLGTVVVAVWGMTADAIRTRRASSHHGHTGRIALHH